jgi:hypothetical protein
VHDDRRAGDVGEDLRHPGRYRRLPGGRDADQGDYEQTVEPLLDEARRHGRRLRLLLQLGPEYEGFTAGAVWGKTQTWLQYPSLLRMIDGYALVSDIRWLREWINLVGFLLPFPLRVFNTEERDDAVAWLGSLPEGPGVTHRLLPESGVVVVEVTEPLRAQDFDAVAATADAWLDTHDALCSAISPRANCSASSSSAVGRGSVDPLRLRCRSRVTTPRMSRAHRSTLPRLISA